MDSRWLIGLIMIGCAPAPPPSPAAPAPAAEKATVAGFVDQLGSMSLAQHEIAKGTPPDRLLLATLFDADGNISPLARPVLGGTFTFEPAPNQLVLRGPLDSDPARVLTIHIVSSAPTVAHLVNRAGEPIEELGPQGQVRVTVSRDPKTAPSQAARLRTASLWALIGENINAPYAPAEFAAAVLGTKLLKSEIPAMFAAPGQGTWVLLKTMTPDEMYVAFDTSTGRTELFPKTPNEPNAAARAVFRAL
jgi:hypothetical protein